MLVPSKSGFQLVAELVSLKILTNDTPRAILDDQRDTVNWLLSEADLTTVQRQQIESLQSKTKGEVALDLFEKSDIII